MRGVLPGRCALHRNERGLRTVPPRGQWDAGRIAGPGRVGAGVHGLGTGVSERWPTFLVIGAYKSGTTALHHALRSHPDVFVPERKEPDYFAFGDLVPNADAHDPAYAGAVRRAADYHALFAGADAATAVGEVSPAYLASPAAASAIARVVPGVTLLAVLRNPVDRAYADWLMYVRDGRESASFRDAIDAQEERARRGDPTGRYLSTGAYAVQLERYLEVFPREQVHVWTHDEFEHDPDRVLGEMYVAIGVDPARAGPRDDVRHNRDALPATRRDRMLLTARMRLRPVLAHLPLGGLRRRMSSSLDARLVRPDLDAETRALLTERMREEIVALGRLVDLDVTPWLSGGDA